MERVTHLLGKLSKFYWSPEVPESYTIDIAGRRAGIGLIAHQDYAAFNYTWAAYRRDLKSELGQTLFIRDWTQARNFTSVPVFDQPLSWWLTFKTQEEFKVWYRLNRASVPGSAHNPLDLLIGNELQSLQ